MTPFVHLHVHSQYSVLDGQASVTGIVDKAMSDGMPGVALTDHGTMYGIKEFTNYIKKKNGKTKDAIKEAEKAAEKARNDGDDALAAEATAKAQSLRAKIFKPIIGCEMYVAEKDLHEHVDKRDTGRHLIVLAKNERGYHNLIKLVSQAWTEGFYSHPRTDKPTLAAHREGLIICSACLGGELPKLLTAGDEDAADRCVAWWKETFGDDYYIELQRHKATVPRANHEAYELQRRIEPQLIALARKHGVKLVATNDVHFTNEEDAEAHDRLICLSTGKMLDDPDRMLYSKQEWLKTQAEMNEVFADIPEALANTTEILDKVEAYSIDHAPIMPTFAIPESFGTEEEYRSRITEQELFDEFTRDEHGNVVLSQEDAEAKIRKLGGYDKLYRIKFEADYLRKLAYDGAAKRYDIPLDPEVDERIRFELHIMKTMGFPGYFLIVEDFIRAGREQLGVKIGPGRGSAAGSVVAYCLGITQIDPLKYDLLFERFLNPDRISLPDIDIDFDDDGREDVLHYVTQKYGEEKVAHIITYGTMAAKSAIKDVARVVQLPLPESNRLAGLVPKRMPEVNGKELKTTLKNCYEHVDDFKNELQNPNPLVQDTLRYALALEGNVRNTGVHACGVIICRDDVTDWVPVSTAVDKKDGKVLVTQYEGSVIEETGLIKMDFLGLKTLSIIKEAIANIKQTHGIDVDIDNIPLDDPKTYALYCAGRTIGTFQFESTGMQRYLRELQPSTFEDLIAMNALYRPGPMQYIPDFIARKHGRAPIVYDIPEMEKYLKDTYGVTVYQEQVMLLSRLLAGFTRGQSDSLRKAMGKKLIAKMEELKDVFFKGGQERGHDVKVLDKIWEDWKQFASYAFNKSHATCYSWVAFQTAYLKANYPPEYMAAVLSRNLNDITKLVGFMDECKAMKIRVLGPDINESRTSFSVNSAGDIRFGLMAIKGVGEGVARAIIEERDANGTYRDIYDLVERIPAGVMNRKVLENLALAGAFDRFTEIQREDFFAETLRGGTLSEVLIRYGAQTQNARQEQQASLFGDDDEVVAAASRPPIEHVMPWTAIMRLERERELVGIYMSAHPLDPYYMELSFGVKCTLAQRDALGPQDGMEINFGGLVLSNTPKTTRKGDPMQVVKIEDFTGTSEIILFGRNIYEYGHLCQPGTPVLVTGTYSKGRYGDDVRFRLDSVRLLDDIKGTLIDGITLKVADDDLTPQFSLILNDILDKPAEQQGTLSFSIFSPRYNRKISMRSARRIPLTRATLQALDDCDIEYEVQRRH